MSGPRRCDNCLCRHWEGEPCRWISCPRCEERAAVVAKHRSGRINVVCTVYDCQYTYETEAAA